MLQGETHRTILDDKSLDLLFRAARSQNGWLPGEVSNADLKAIWDIAKWGPTSANSLPLRMRFVRSHAAKNRVRPHLHPSNVDKVMAAPVVAIFGFDLNFYQHLPRLFHNPAARGWYEGEHKKHSLRNGVPQFVAAKCLLAVRALGFECGSMSGFNKEAVDREFWRYTGDPTKLYQHHPRFDFPEVAEIL